MIDAVDFLCHRTLVFKVCINQLQLPIYRTFQLYYPVSWWRRYNMCIVLPRGPIEHIPPLNVWVLLGSAVGSAVLVVPGVLPTAVVGRPVVLGWWVSVLHRQRRLKSLLGLHLPPPPPTPSSIASSRRTSLVVSHCSANTFNLKYKVGLRAACMWLLHYT